MSGGQAHKGKTAKHLANIIVRREHTNQDGRAAGAPHYLYFQSRKVQQQQTQSEACISMQKGARGSTSFTAGNLCNDAGRKKLIQHD